MRKDLITSKHVRKFILNTYDLYLVSIMKEYESKNNNNYNV